MTRAADIFAKVVLWTAFLFMPFLAHAGGLGIQIIGSLMGLGGAAIAIAYKIPIFTKNNLWIWPFITFLIWANITALWSPYESRGFTNAHKILLTGLILIFIPYLYANIKTADKHFYRHLLIAGSIMSAGLMAIDVISGWSLSLWVDPPKADEMLGKRQGDAMMNLGHGLYSYAQMSGLLLVMIMLYLKKRWRWLASLFFVCALVIGSFFNDLMIAILVIFIVLIVLAVAYWRPRFALTLSFFTAIISIIFAPVLGIIAQSILPKLPNEFPTSWEHRLQMWAYSWQEIKSSLFLGKGFDASRIYQDTYISNAGYELVIVSLHPHNIGLQIWLEVGGVGALLFCCALALLWKPALLFSDSKHKAAAVSAIVIATSIIGATTIGVWQFWWWGLIGFMVANLALITNKTPLHK